MQEMMQTLAAGSVIHRRYLIKAMLGTGGFSAVYLVQDLEGTAGATGATEAAGTSNLFALKQLSSRNRQERERFTFEGEVLMRLQHPSLPRIQRIFDDEESGQACIIMDYIQGSNLEVLRRQQPHKRFPLAQALRIMQPVVEAITYLHGQQPPIIHRDVKPSNIIVPEGGDRAVLVDFGIAKEYSPDSTTTAIRHCSPGYGAPEQYSTGTDLRTDVYGLGATFYAILSGEVPVDALRRATRMASEGIDPLVPLQDLVAALPAHVAVAIHRAMSIGSDKRFATIEEFWQALHSPARSMRLASVNTGPPLLDEDAQEAGRKRAVTASPPRALLARKGSLSQRALLICACVLLIGASAALGLWANSASRHSAASVTATGVRAHATTTTAAAGITVGALPGLSDTYNGTIYNLLTHVSVKVHLTQFQQNNASVLGRFTGGQMQGSLRGVLDTSQHIFITLTTKTGSFFFEGTVHSDGNMAGNYCSQDQHGQCYGDYGLWSLSPAR